MVDASKSALPGATVTATNLATEVVTTRLTTEAGVYVLSPLPPGEYRVTVTLQGFDTAVREGIVVDALTTVGLNVTLTVAGVKQDVVVTAESPQLATADARLGQTIRNEVYTALPLVMNTGGPRDPTAFMFLMPGVQSVGRWGNVMGGQDFTNDTYVDGIPITNAVVQGEGRNLSFGISVESIEQFQVETSGTAVMYNGQGASNYVVKSGTNQFRGSAFEYFRNKALDSKAFFASAKPDDNQHEFGFTAGGPIRRSRMFFFSAYDGYRDRRQTEQRLVSIPTLAQRRGDFSALPVAIYDPRTTRPNPAGTGFIRDPFPGNVIPQERLSPISRYFQSFLPDPTNGDLQNNYLGGNLPIGFDNDNVTAKVDVTMTSRQQASVMVAYGRRAQSTAYRGGGNAQTALPLPYTETRLVEEVPTTAQLKHTYVLGARWVNQASFGFSRLSVPIFECDDRRTLSHRGRTDRTAARRSRFVIPRSELRRTERADAVARHRRPGLHRVPEQLHPSEQSQLDARQACDDVRIPGSADGRQRARADVRQPRDVRLQQRARPRGSVRPGRFRPPPGMRMRVSSWAI